MAKPEVGRRPIPAREAGWARSIARWLAAGGVTPNQISLFSVFSSGLCFLCLVLSRDATDGPRVALLLAAAATIPIRAACNIFDGMVAVEHGKGTRSGVIFNELPDRVSDALMLVGAGYAVPGIAGAEALGWAAAILAVLTAYVRALGASAGAGHDFGGVMAKQQRMAVVTTACVLSAFEGLWGAYGYVLLVALAIVAAGSLVTIGQRTVRAIRRLEAE